MKTLLIAILLVVICMAMKSSKEAQIIKVITEFKNSLGSFLTDKDDYDMVGHTNEPKTIKEELVPNDTKDSNCNFFKRVVKSVTGISAPVSRLADFIKDRAAVLIKESAYAIKGIGEQAGYKWLNITIEKAAYMGIVGDYFKTYATKMLPERLGLTGENLKDYLTSIGILLNCGNMFWHGSGLACAVSNGEGFVLSFYGHKRNGKFDFWYNYGKIKFSLADTMTFLHKSKVVLLYSHQWDKMHYVPSNIKDGQVRAILTNLMLEAPLPQLLDQCQRY
eukprot:TRINITY_DN70788_c0_g1_i1.p1 TRINITY_DN70788_c0_g1~~TRINITY_DN70788_c0_g1_i1.p1  ORF type:complete len:277 (-),score=13.04 TRINITY_DN70788_c0_g1_i1:149-979(-)